MFSKANIPGAHRIDLPSDSAYILAIENLANTSADSVFEASKPANIAVVLGNVFRKANKSVKIYAGSLAGEIPASSYYLESLELFLSRRLPMTIILDNYPDSRSPAVELIEYLISLN